MELNKIYCGDAIELLKQLPDKFINSVICSPPYFNLRSYLSLDDPNKAKEFGCYTTPEEYVEQLCTIYDEVYRILKDDGCCFVNLGDTYLGSGKGVWVGRSKAHKESFQFAEKPKEKLGGWKKSKQLALIPSRFAIAMQERGWILRNKIIWHKKNAIPQSCKDRFVVDYEEVLLFVKSKKYYFNQLIEPFANSSNLNEIYNGKANKDYEKERAQNPSDTKRRILASMRKRGGGRSMRSVWSINTKRAKGNHTASFPEELVNRMIKSSCPANGIVLDMFCGTGTTCKVAQDFGLNFLGFDLNPEYVKISEKRLNYGKCNN